MYGKSFLKAKAALKSRRKTRWGGFIEVNLCKEKGAKKVLLYMSVEEQWPLLPCGEKMLKIMVLNVPPSTASLAPRQEEDKSLKNAWIFSLMMHKNIS